VGLCGLFATGLVSSVISGSPKTRPILRNVIGGSAAMAVTWAISHLFGVGLG
jgi:VIT1/CCC1 family predicted Fe2+/Mn2+ transporter